MSGQTYGHHTAHERAFTDGLAKRRLLVAKCPVCSSVLAYTQRLCPDHPRAGLEWCTASGQATVHTFSIYRIGYADREPPYAVAIVQLDEGPRLSCALPAEEDLRVGMPVFAEFDSAGSLVFRTQPRRDQ
ncbi:Zn-ribbon domain-containing OB-fold protein [Ramlibacter albus]|uniref:OB-fold domain-containing protein n=1 Tax=Ramlibacter albus TaxID=2079448 RepID=A0A923M5A2_9BURK|nr:OB-fold domain-containing protein [Ramlibacter albus]MBC5763001.1 OB-fold domain-containing protein [Ramlibacter albus]